MLLLLCFSTYAEDNSYTIDLDNDGKKETIVVQRLFETISEDSPPLQINNNITIFKPDGTKANSFFMPDRMGEIEFISLNKDGLKQIVAWSSGGAHYTNIAIYGYLDGELFLLFQDGSACLIEVDFEAEKPTIEVGRANWEKEGWSYASGGHGDSLWQVYIWNHSCPN